MAATGTIEVTAGERVGPDRWAVVTLAFATTVAMWGVAYLARLPVVTAPSWILGVLLLACLLGGGWATGVLAGRGVRTAAGVGLLAGILNLLVLGGLLSGGRPNQVVPSALWWVPGSLVASALLAAAGAAMARRMVRPAASRPLWTAVFARVAVAATFLLLLAGGLVTSAEAGLAVVDWPNSFGYAMFLYPLSRMTGGIYYEHAHRLFGSLVGLTTVVLAVQLWRMDPRRWVKGLGIVAVAAVVVQGLLGGLRVTGRLTLSTSPEDMVPNLGLAMAHGVLGQLFFALLVALAVFTTSAYRRAPAPARTGGADRALQSVLLAALVLQLMLGAVQRHLAQGLLVHITMAVVVTVLAVLAGSRAWGLYPELRPVERAGRILMILVGIQVVLGFAALVVTGGEAVVGDPGTLEVTVATLHQATGALLLASTVVLLLWTRRLTSPL